MIDCSSGMYEHDIQLDSGDRIGITDTGKIPVFFRLLFDYV